jgi:hypothetical protein
VITRKSQLLINFLNVRVIVNGKQIYTLPVDKPVIVSLTENKATFVATDGFHITKPLELTYPLPQTFYLNVVCAIDNNLLLTGFVLLVIFSLVGVVSDLFFLRMLSFFPILYFLFFYYINRKDFLQIKARY